MAKRSVFFISDRTGITVQAMGHSLLTQFPGEEFDWFAFPFVDTVEKMRHIVELIRAAKAKEGAPPVVFSTLVDVPLYRLLKESEVKIYDFFATFIPSLEQDFGVDSTHAAGRTHGIHDEASYDQRVAAVNFALAHDDGIGVESMERAEVILLGVSRSGKTPTTLYLAMQFAIFTANYPLTDEHFPHPCLPNELQKYRHKLFGLSIESERLHHIRSERRPNSHYASLTKCRQETQWAERLFRQEKIPYLNTTTRSIEEIAVAVINRLGLRRLPF